MILKIGSTDDLPKAAAAILESLDGRSVVAFRGEMGAGKTTLIRAICDALGVTDTVTSPTFAIVNEYRERGFRRCIISIFTGSTGSRRLSISGTRSISTAATCAWSSGPKRLKACCRTMR